MRFSSRHIKNTARDVFAVLVMAVSALALAGAVPHAAAAEGDGEEIMLAMAIDPPAPPARQSPVIKVLDPTGGGGPDSAGVNQFALTFCGGAVPYSWCYSGYNTEHRNNLIENYVEGLRAMTTELSAVIAQQTQIFGSFLDAEHQLNTQRDLQALVAEAHKDYQPSEQMCAFGTFTRSLARTEQKGAMNEMAFNELLQAAYGNRKDSAAGRGNDSDILSRIIRFRTQFCDVNDSNGGLANMCDHDQNFSGGPAGAQDKTQINKDIDYARTILAPSTLAIDYADGSASSADEQAALELARNLYWPRALEPFLGEDLKQKTSAYGDLRSVMAVFSVAHNSFSNILAQKSQSDTAAGAQSGWNYMKAMMKDFGLRESEINALLGDYPSYYAQMDVLTKKIYQSPDFYTNLYDKPLNVKRTGVAMDAFKLMQGRDMLESALRREMLTSMLVEEALRTKKDAINGRLSSTARAR